MLTGMHARRWIGAILFALVLPHADPGGLIQCVRPDGSRSFEFACGCAEEKAQCSCGHCGCVSSDSEEAAARWSTESDGCTDFTMSLNLAPVRAELSSPLFQIVQPVPIADLSFSLQTAGLKCSGNWLAERSCGPPDRPGSNSVFVLRI